MVDLTPVLALLRERRTGRDACPHAGAGRGRPKLLNERKVPAVPTVPGESTGLCVPAAADVLERAAFLEYCGGYDRAAADRLALGEYGLDSREARPSRS
jgi:hypothetical protein